RAHAHFLQIETVKARTCAQCAAPGATCGTSTPPTGSVLAHEQCAKFLPVGAGTADPIMAYRARSAEPDGPGCEVTIIELPRAQRHRKVFGVLEPRGPDHVPIKRWRGWCGDGSGFLARWSEPAEALNWSSADLLGPAPVPAKPHPSYSRLSR